MMKKTAMAIMTTAFCLIISGMACATEPPTIDGNDVLFPDSFIQTISGVTEGNVYCRYHDDPVKWHKMVKEGNVWRAKDAVGKAIHPYVGDPVAEFRPTTNFCKIENVWSLDAPFVRWRGDNPYIYVE
ncbi:MAG: hypothetical protein U9R06_02315 [Patescibacteria group bacterium]|nr:hypothetical protein [Patescibacteria group bacterium]